MNRRLQCNAHAILILRRYCNSQTDNKKWFGGEAECRERGKDRKRWEETEEERERERLEGCIVYPVVINFILITLIDIACFIWLLMSAVA